MNTKKVIALLQVLLMISLQIVIPLSISLSTFEVVFAEEEDLFEEDLKHFCCEKTKRGNICQTVVGTESQKDFLCADGVNARDGKCEDIAAGECTLGCCIRPDKSCLENAPVLSCSGEGFSFYDKSCSEVPACEKKCYLVGRKYFYATAQEYEILAAQFGFTDISPIIIEGISNEAQCMRQSIMTSGEGCCVIGGNYIYTTLSDCVDVKGADIDEGIPPPVGDAWFPGEPCSSDDLRTNYGSPCEPGASTGCIKGKDHVYSFDSCGNREGIAKSCIFSEGELCVEEDGIADCQKMNCKDTLESLDEDGNVVPRTRKHGESWCVSESLGEEVVGGRHWKVLCEYGEEMIESCADYRTEVCKEEIIEVNGKEFSQAKCQPNPSQVCVSQDTKETCESDDYKDYCFWMEREKCVFEDIDDDTKEIFAEWSLSKMLVPGDGGKKKVLEDPEKCAEWEEGNDHELDHYKMIPWAGFEDYEVDGEEIKMPSCLPRTPVGFNINEFALATEDGEEVEGEEAEEGQEAIDAEEWGAFARTLGTASYCGAGSYTCVMHGKKSGGPLGGGAGGSWKYENYECIQKEWVKLMMDRCKSLGDCGVSVNIAGRELEEGYSLYKIDTIPEEDEDFDDFFERFKEDARIFLEKDDEYADYYESITSVKILPMTYEGYFGGDTPGFGLPGGGVIFTIQAIKNLFTGREIWEGAGGGGADEGGAAALAGAGGDSFLGQAAKTSGWAKYAMAGASYMLMTYLGVDETAAGVVSSSYAFSGTVRNVVTSASQRVIGYAAQKFGFLSHADAFKFIKEMDDFKTVYEGIEGIDTYQGFQEVLNMKDSPITDEMMGKFNPLSLDSYTHTLTKNLGWAAGPASLIVQFGVMWLGSKILEKILTELLSSKHRFAMIIFSCETPKPVFGGDDCELCNGDPRRPCSEYRCSSLGTTCKLINRGTTEEQCASIIDCDEDTNAPRLTSIEVSEGHKVIGVEDNQIKIEQEDEECLAANTDVTLKVKTTNPDGSIDIALCKWDFFNELSDIKSYDEMDFEFNPIMNTFADTHIFPLPLPQPLAVTGLDGEEVISESEMNLYAKCKDMCGNPVEGIVETPLIISYCIIQGPDFEAPEIVPPIDPVNGDTLPFGTTGQRVKVTLNEAADCKWSKTPGIDYEEMLNEFDCAHNPIMPICDAMLPIVEDEENFYFRCKDKPWIDEDYVGEEVRVANTEDYKYTLYVGESLTIDSWTPAGTSQSNPAETTELTAETSGDATCYYRIGEEERIEFDTTGSTSHNTEATLDESGDYVLKIECEDSVGSKDESDNIFIRIEIDTTAPLIVRDYHDGSTLYIITNEDTTCEYSFDSFVGFGQGEPMGYGEMHSTLAEFGKEYFIKCQDDSENEVTHISKPIES